MSDHPVHFAVDYPDRDLNRLTTALRIFTVIPIAIVLASIGGYSNEAHWNSGSGGATLAIGGTGLLFLPPLLMILFRQKYPRWWFDWNLELLRFVNRVGIYFALMDDRYPSTDEHQSVYLEFPYPDARMDLSRGLPLVKWFLAIPHYIVLWFLYIGAFFAVIVAWFAILFTGRYPRGIFNYVEGVIRWHNRVVGYAFILVTDAYPPFRLGAWRAAVVAAIAVLVISLGAILAGRGYVRTARKMQSFATTRGHVTAREVVMIAGLSREGRWGQGGSYRPKVSYDYTVDGVAYTSDRTSYANRGLRRSLAEQQLAAIPDEVDVYYDPAAPQQAYLEKHTPTLGRYLLAGGGVGMLFGLILLLGSV